MDPQNSRRIAAALGLVFATIPCGSLRAQDHVTLSGIWTASAMNVQYNIGDWGDKCGARPSGGGPGGGAVTIQQAGSELTITGAGGTYSTTNCFEQGSGLRRVSHSASARGWSNRCTTAANDPRQAVVITTISATDTIINFNETGTYQFVLEGQNCTASVRRTRSFTLVQRAGETPTAPAETASAKPAATEAPSAATRVVPAPKETAPPVSCTEVGEPARIEARPARKLMRPGEEFTFRARAVDAKGCLVSAQPAWVTTASGAKVSMDAMGTVRVAADAPEGTSDFWVALNGQRVRVSVEVASKDRYEALLAAQGLNEKGEAEEAAVLTIATGSLGGGRAVGEDTARRRKVTFAAILGSLALGLAGLALVVKRRAAKRAAREEAEAAEAAAAAAAAKAASGTKMQCPICQQTFPMGSQFCPADGTQLVHQTESPGKKRQPGGICPTCHRGFDPSVRTCPEHGEILVPAAVYKAAGSKSPESGPKGKICPTCGERYAGEAQFCGKDGTTLVLVN